MAVETAMSFWLRCDWICGFIGKISDTYILNAMRKLQVQTAFDRHLLGDVPMSFSGHADHPGLPYWC